MQTLKAQKPWITASTIQLLERRKAARVARDYEEEQVLAPIIKASVKRDRTSWLENLTATGDWNEIRKLRKGFVPNQGRLKNMAGDLVESNLRAETLAEHLEKVQWAVRPVSMTEGKTGLIANLLPVELGNITKSEICSAAKHLNTGKSLQWALEFCQKCWEENVVLEIT